MLYRGKAHNGGAALVAGMSPIVMVIPIDEYPIFDDVTDLFDQVSEEATN